MSFYGIETGLTSFFTGADKRPEDRNVVASRIKERLAELRASGVLGDFDDDDEAAVAQPPANELC